MSNNSLIDLLWPGYPRVTEEQAYQWLGSPYPAWQFTPEGMVTTANLMAFWLWRAIDIKSHEVQPKHVLKVSVFDVVARNLDYIPVTENEVFFKKIVWDAKRIGQQLGRAGRNSTAAFISAMQSDQQRREIYEEVILFDEAHRSSGREREREYPLRIVTPPNGDKPKDLLPFTIAQAVVCGQKGCSGLVSRARSTAESRALIRQEYRKLTRQYAIIPYVLSAKTNGGDSGIERHREAETQNRNTPEDDEPVDLMFEDGGKYVEFMKYAFEHPDSCRVAFPYAPINTAVRLKRSVLERIPQDLISGAHLVTKEDIDRQLSRLKDRDLFDLQDLQDSLGAVLPHIQRLNKR